MAQAFGFVSRFSGLHADMANPAKYISESDGKVVMILEYVDDSLNTGKNISQGNEIVTKIMEMPTLKR